jgi:hypothetical protein
MTRKPRTPKTTRVEVPEGEARDVRIVEDFVVSVHSRPDPHFRAGELLEGCRDHLLLGLARIGKVAVFADEEQTEGDEEPAQDEPGGTE